MPKYKYTCGDKAGMLTLDTRINGRYGYFICDCGNRKKCRISHVFMKDIKSCGCSQNAMIGDAHRNNDAYKDGKRIKEYGVWKGMRSRCNNPNNKEYKNYGGRGIKVCERWGSFSSFLQDMGPRPSRHHSIERVNYNIGYTPENCRWATSMEQGANRRNNVVIEYQGETHIMANWARILGVDKTIFRNYYLRNGFEKSYHHYIQRKG